MSEHTPGPWRTFNGTDVYPDDNDREGSRHIADCNMSATIAGHEQRANAILIAAAPELLVVLREATLALDGLAKGEGVFKPIEQTIRAVKAVLAKASPSSSSIQEKSE